MAGAASTLITVISAILKTMPQIVHDEQMCAEWRRLTNFLTSALDRLDYEKNF